jgi:hypothetical protein
MKKWYSYYLAQVTDYFRNCWGPSSSEGPQKHDLTIFPKNIWTGTFGLGSKPYTIWEARTIRRMTQLRSHAQGSFGIAEEGGTDLKGKRLYGPQWIILKSIVNVKGMIVILHRLRPVPINRWTVPPYCSRWLVLICATLVLLSSIEPKVHL